VSYDPKELEEYADLDLHDELERRRLLRNAGQCSYCEKTLWAQHQKVGAADRETACRLHEQVVGLDRQEGNVVVERRA